METFNPYGTLSMKSVQLNLLELVVLFVRHDAYIKGPLLLVAINTRQYLCIKNSTYLYGT
jgi:hypothetical protein